MSLCIIPAFINSQDMGKQDFSYYRIEDADGWSNMRASAGGEIIRRVYPNERFTIIGTDHKYKIVQFEDAETGYIHISRIVIAETDPETVISHIMQNIFDLNYEEVIKYFIDENGFITGEKRKKLLESMESGGDLRGMIEDHGPVKSFRIAELEKIGESRIWVNIEVIFEDNYKDMDELEFTEYKGLWVIYME